MKGDSLTFKVVTVGSSSLHQKKVFTGGEILPDLALGRPAGTLREITQNVKNFYYAGQFSERYLIERVGVRGSSVRKITGLAPPGKIFYGR